MPVGNVERKQNQMQGSRSHVPSAPARQFETRALLGIDQNAMPQKKGHSSMRNSALLIASLVICSAQFLRAQSQNPITINPEAGGFQANPPLTTPGGWPINTPVGPAPEYNPEAQPAATNELIGGGGKKNIIEEATQRLWRLILTVQGGAYYDSNIFITQTHPIGSVVIELAGGFTFEIGDYRSKANNFLTLKYLATGYIYTGTAGHNNTDGVEQQFELHGQYRWERLTAQGNLSFSYLNGPDRLAGTFTTSYLIDGLFRLLYDYSDKTQLHAEFEQITDIYPSELDSYEYIGRLGADYQILPKIKLGLEGVVGDLQGQTSGNSTYGEGLFRAAYKMTEKVTFLGSAGFEVVHYNGRNLTKVTPVFDLSAQWSPFVGTGFGLTAFRRIFASPVEVGQVFTATGIQGSVSQVFLQKFVAGVFVGYEHDAYQASVSNAPNINRTDDYVYVRPNLTYSIGGWCNLVLYYQFSHNNSTLGGASFDDHRVGGQVIFAF
jgi:Putative beta-barrel porin 2